MFLYFAITESSQHKINILKTIKILSLTTILILLQFSAKTFAQVGINTTSPASGSLLDVSSENKGMLVPRVDIADLTTIAPITGGATESLLVYNTNTSTGKGFHYWSGSVWTPIDNDWKLNGNTGTDDTVNFIGTIDDESLVFKSGNTEAMRINTNESGQLLIGTTVPDSPTDLLQVLSDVEIGGGATNNDFDSENLKIRGRSQDWYINVGNKANSDDTDFYFGKDTSPGNSPFLIKNNGDIVVGFDDDNPDAEFHVVNDQDEATTIRIDNSDSSNSRTHTEIEFTDGGTLKAFIKNNNVSNTFSLGHNENAGRVFIFAGNNGANGAIKSTKAMTFDGLGNVSIGSDDDTPNAELHLVKDQDQPTVFMIDNSNSTTNTVHSSIELWDGSSDEKAFFRHNNFSDVLQIGHSEQDGVVEFFSGDGTSDDSDVTMTLENDSSVTIEKLINIKPGNAPATPKTGDVYYDQNTNKLRVFTPSGWEDLN